MTHLAKGKVKMATVEAVVIRKDGTREDLGIVSYWHANPLRRWWWQLNQWAKGKHIGKVREANGQTLN